MEVAFRNGPKSSTFASLEAAVLPSKVPSGQMDSGLQHASAPTGFMMESLGSRVMGIPFKMTNWLQGWLLKAGFAVRTRESRQMEKIGLGGLVTDAMSTPD